jgi:outer membrane receptor protein involved in Fe transport
MPRTRPCLHPADGEQSPALRRVQREQFGLQQKTTYQAFLPKGGLSWEVAPDKTVSAIVQRGYRSGGNGINPGRAQALTYDPEYTWNYELSLRTQWLDRRLTLNANAFYIDWTDQQVNVQLSENHDYKRRTRASRASGASKSKAMSRRPIA